MLWGYIGLFFFAMVKFIFSPWVAMAIPENNWFYSWIIIVFGGLVGCSFFYYSAGYFMERAARKNGDNKKKNFTKLNKTVIKVKHGIGIYGLALLTASFISIPLGAIITAKFYRHKKRTIFILYSAIVLIGSLLTFIAYFL